MDIDEQSQIEKMLKATRFNRCFDCSHFRKEDLSCDGKVLWTVLMLQDEWYLKMTPSHFPIGCKIMDEKFTSNPKRREYDICKNCRHFLERHDGGCMCWNTLEYRSGRRRWCQETNEEISSELFEKATFDIWDKDQCLYENGHQPKMPSRT